MLLRDDGYYTVSLIENGVQPDAKFQVELHCGVPLKVEWSKRVTALFLKLIEKIAKRQSRHSRYSVAAVIDAIRD